MTNELVVAPALRDVPSKVQLHHHDRLAVVYIRQSSLQQVQNNQESTRLQYGLVDLGLRFGWSRDRILVIDEDLGISGASAEGRPGFQRLLREVALDHVGLIVGIEMSRLARSNRDWHQLLELCARFGTLIADLDGLYDPGRYNDRLLLGLKGTMSEAELHILRQRLLEGKLHKARRGELGKPVPTGYLRQPSGEVALDPDQQVRAVVELIFEQFDRIGSIAGVLRYLVQNGLEIGVRLRTGPDIGRLEWRRPQRGLVGDILRNPIYAGAYVYGRRRTDPRRKQPGRPGTGRSTLVAPDRWQVCLKDRLPAYITWERYAANQERLTANRAKAKGVPREGFALLQGLLVCGRCGRRMSVQYGQRKSGARWSRYVCQHDKVHYGAPVCQGLSGRGLDEEITRQTLEALAPAALEVSLQVAQNIERERTRVEQLWAQRLERAAYDADRARRQYETVDPENRLVARSLEASWEERLRAKRLLEEEYHRFSAERPRVITDEERRRIHDAAADIPAIWAASTTTNSDRKAILRLLVERVTVEVLKDSEEVDLTIEWAGGHETSTWIKRPVGRLTDLKKHEELLARIVALREDGWTAGRIAGMLNDEGWVTPTQRAPFNERLVRSLIFRYDLPKLPSARRRAAGREEDEWMLHELADELEIPEITLYGWLRRGWLTARKSQGRGSPWLVFMDNAEQQRLVDLRNRSARYGRRKVKTSAKKDSP